MTRAGSTVRVLTWNVHGCVGRDRVCDPDRVTPAQVGGKLGLERFDLRPEHVPGPAEHPLDGGPVPGRVGGEAGAQVVERDGERGHSIILDGVGRMVYHATGRGGKGTWPVAAKSAGCR